MMKRVNAHAIETRAVDFVRSSINRYYTNGDALYREISGRDYGIDAIIELFNNGTPTGNIAFVQVKGTEKNVTPLRGDEEISCQITSSNAQYVKQSNIPILLMYVSLNNQTIYFIRLQDLKIDNNKINRQKKITIHIPLENSFQSNGEKLFENIREYYKETLKNEKNIKIY